MKHYTSLQLRPLFAVAMLFFTIVSCKKETAAPAKPAVDAKTAFLTAAPWIISKWQVKTKDSLWISFPLTDFQKSITETYKTDNTYISTSASNTGGIETITGKWRFGDNETKLLLTSSPGDHTNSSGIIVLNATTLQFTGATSAFDWTDDAGVTTTYYAERVIFSHP